jgi:CubicO group peptidase (beta-lactamase class C family)
MGVRARGASRAAAALAAALAGLALGAPGAGAAKRCKEPGAGDWSRATPAQAGMDAERLQAALDYGSTQTSFAVRVYRHGCLVGEDRAAAANRTQTFQSWSMAKSITALVFMRAMTKRLISPEDPLGSLVTEADRAHGAITMRNLLTMTNGLRWNGFRDYNIFMQDRLREALTVEVARRPGTYYEYSQSGPALLAEAVARAVDEDFQAFAQRELFGPLGIEAGSWRWGRDSAGHTQGFFDLFMTPDDYARLGELMRRDGVWRGRRLLSRRAVRAAVRPTQTNGCYAWMIWVNAAKPCVGPRVGSRPVDDAREFPELPADMYHYAGLFGQIVAVFPSQGVVIVRTGQEGDAGGFTGGGDWQNELFKRVLGAITDQRIRPPRDARDVRRVSREDVDGGFHTAFFEPEQYLGGIFIPPLPPAGPARSRAIILEQLSRRVLRGGAVPVWGHCPRRSSGTCVSPLRMRGAKPLKLRLGPGKGRRFTFRLRPGALRKVRRQGRLRTRVHARNPDATGGSPSNLPLRLLAPRR